MTTILNEQIITDTGTKTFILKHLLMPKLFFTSIPVLFEFINPLKRFSPKNQMFLCVCVCMCEDVCSASMGEGQWCPPEWGARGLRTACPLSPGTGCSAKTIGTTPQTHCLPYQSTTSHGQCYYAYI